MALVLAVETRQSDRDVALHGSVSRWKLRAERGEICAGGRARLVRTIWAVTVVVVDLREGDCDGGIGNACKGVCRLVEFGN